MKKMLASILSDIGASRLCELVGREKVEFLEELGVGINAESLADFIAEDQGIDFLKSVEVRVEILHTLDPALIRGVIDAAADPQQAMLDFVSFKWSSKAKKQKFLELVGLADESLEGSSPREPTSRPAEPAEPLHVYQNSIRRVAVQKLLAGPRRFLLHMPTGAGKTRTSLELVCDFMRQCPEQNFCTVWFAHSEELCEQAASAFEKIWERMGPGTCTVIRLWGGRAPPKNLAVGPKFIVTSFATGYRLSTAQTDAKFALALAIKKENRLTLVDEAHQATANTYRTAIDVFTGRSSSVIGLSATPGRHGVGGESEESTLDLADYFSDGLIGMMDEHNELITRPIRYLTDLGYLSKVKRVQLNTDEAFELTEAEKAYVQRKLEIPDSVLERMSLSASRTQLIAACAAKYAVDDRKQVIVFAPTKDNALMLASLLRSRGVKAQAVVGDSSEKARKEAINDFRSGEINVLTNFGVLTTGFDAPAIETVIVARPTTSVVLYSQMVGRGLRGPAMGGTDECTVVDVMDNIGVLPVFDEAFSFFTNFYD